MLQRTSYSQNHVYVLHGHKHNTTSERVLTLQEMSKKTQTIAHHHFFCVEGLKDAFISIHCTNCLEREFFYHAVDAVEAGNTILGKATIEPSNPVKGFRH